MRKLKKFLISGVVGIFLIYAMTAAINVEPKYITYQNYTVEHDDTLWDIAEEFMPESDPRSVVYEIQEMNGLGSEFIQPGDVLKIPVLLENGTLVAEE